MKALVVDDEKLIVKGLKFSLEQEGYEVDCAYDGQEAVDKAKETEYDIVLLDLMLPILTGYEVCQQIREFSDMPIIMLTARAEELDKVLGLEMGADDYVTKPFGTRELIARVKANLRRSVAVVENTKKSVNVLDFGKLQIDLDKFEARKQDKVLELTFREFELLKFLAQNMTQVFSRETLL